MFNDTHTSRYHHGKNIPNFKIFVAFIGVFVWNSQLSDAQILGMLGISTDAPTPSNSSNFTLNDISIVEGNSDNSNAAISSMSSISEEPTMTPSLLESSSPSLIASLEPSLEESESPSEIQSNKPSVSSSTFPTLVASSHPSIVRSNFPSITPSTLHSELPSIISTTFPSMKPSLHLSESPSTHLSLSPSITNNPTTFPSISPSLVSSESPSISTSPSSSPTLAESQFPSYIPSHTPTHLSSRHPSSTPTQFPSIYESISPSFVSSSRPSAVPSTSNHPSILPTYSFSPTFLELQVDTQTFEQTFLRQENAQFSPAQQRSFCEVLRGYTSNFDSDLNVNVECIVKSQDLRQLSGETRHFKNIFRKSMDLKEEEEDSSELFQSITQKDPDDYYHYPNIANDNDPFDRRKLQTGVQPVLFSLVVTYTMNYTSNVTSVDGYAKGFQNFLNKGRIVDEGIILENLETLKNDLGSQGISVTTASVVSEVFIPTLRPSVESSSKPSNLMSSAPSQHPSNMPTLTNKPSNQPSLAPIMTNSPSAIPKTPFPTLAPTTLGSNTVGAIMGAIATLAVLGFAVFYYYTATHRKEPESPRQKRPSRYDNHDPPSPYYNYPSGRNPPSDPLEPRDRPLPPQYKDDTLPPPPLPRYDPSDQGSKASSSSSRASRSSHTSSSHRSSSHPNPLEYYSHPGGGPPAPPYANFQVDDQASNRSLISAGYSVGSDSIIEQDATNLLRDEFDEYRDTNLEQMRYSVEQFFPESSDMISQAMTRAYMLEEEEWMAMELQPRTALELEVTELCNTHEWKRKRPGASEEEKRNYLQVVLNHLVILVLQNLLPPEDASRTILGCASLLNLALYTELEKTTLIVTGLRKTAETKFVQESFEEFGEVAGVALARGFRGFGLVRFRSTKAVQRAKEKFNKEEIVVQDVGVMIKVLESETPVQDRRATLTPTPPPIMTSQQRPTRPQVPSYPSIYNDGRDTIGYPDGRYDKYKQLQFGKPVSAELGSDSGKSANSFASSSKRSHHSRDPSGGASITSSTSGAARRKLTKQ